MNTDAFVGTGVAIVTPFREDRSIDFNALDRLIDYQISNGVNYLVVLGTTGESSTLTNDEKQAVINFVIEKVEKRVPIILGIGGNNTQNIVDQIHKQNFDGISALLSVSPYYNKPSQEGIFQHYTTIANNCPVPVMLYNVPGRTGSNINAETTLRLANHNNIFAVKEASADLTQIAKIIKDKPDDFMVISGDDPFIIPLIAMGGHGVISVCANAFPKEISDIVNLSLAQNYKDARQIYYQLCDVIKYLFIEGNPVGVKAALSVMNIISNNLRLPLVPMSEPNYDDFEKIIKKLQVNQFSV
jgi:4-hydroxy-tetrahydrodipicolinate synthase